MAHDSPFGIKRAASTVKDENSVRFTAVSVCLRLRFGCVSSLTHNSIQLKPICVELLGSITKNKGGSNVDPVVGLLKKLHACLATFISPLPDRVPLSPSLINYVFFPLAQLLRSTTAGEADLPDRVRQAIFQILSSLASDWWQTWTDCTSPTSADTIAKVQDQWKVWEQLVILGAVALGGPPDGKSQSHKSSSEETQLAICSFLQELLLPRLATAATASTKIDHDWEWDGEEELPSLDDFDRVQEATNGKRETDRKEDTVQVYPSTGHLEHIYSSKACRGAIAHALTASLDLASAKSTSAAVRVACLQISRAIICSWLAGQIYQIESRSSLFRQITVEKISGGRRASDSNESKAASQADRVAVFLPGYVSSMVRILGSISTRDNSQVTSQALLSLAAILGVCLCDDASRGLTLSSRTNTTVDSSQPAATIDELVARVNLDNDTLSHVDASPENEEKGKVQPLDELSKRNNEWLHNTVAHVVIALFSVDPIASHNSSQVQLAIIHLAYTLLAHCSSVLGLQRTALLQSQDNGDKSIDAIRLLLRWIVDIAASDSSMESASTSAHDSLRLLFSSDSRMYKDAVIDEMLDIVQSIPTLLATQSDDDVEKKANRLRFLLSLSTSGFDNSLAAFDGAKKLLQPSSAVDKWGTSLLYAIRVDDRASMGHDSTLVTLQGLSPSTSKAVLGIFEELGRCLSRLVKRDCSAGVEVTAPFDLIWSFMDQASTNRSTLMTASSEERHSRLLCQNALIVVDRMTQGVSELLDDSALALQTSKEGKKLRRIAHRFAKEMIRRVSDMWMEDEEELLQQDVSARQQNRSSEERSLLLREHQDRSELATVERRSGVGEEKETALERPAGFGPALKLDFVSPATLPSSGAVQVKIKSPLQLQTEAKTQLDRSDALLLSILTSSSRILGPALKPLLLKLMYPIICGVASQSTAIRDAAMESMDEIARSAGYASVQGCVLDHADYVLGTASHRLVSTLGQELQAVARRDSGADMVHFPLVSAQSAPLVLVEIIRMLGGEALTLVQDAIDEVLDAIDRHHLQDILCDDLLNVLSRLVEVMLEDERLKDDKDRKTEHSIVNSASIAFHPDVDRDMEELQKWWHRRQRKETVPEPEEARGEVPEDASQDQDEPDTASPSQAVVVSILEKAVPFLSHSSAMIRIRCLKLLNKGIELLCLQRRTVEPLQIINKAWPVIMSRLGFSLSLSLPSALPAYEDLSERDFVACTEAAKLVTTLAKYLVEYLGPKKMLQQAVPRLLLLLKIVERADGRTQQGRQGNTRTFLLKGEPTVSIAPPSHNFKQLQRFSPLYTMTETVFFLLDTLVDAMGPRISEADLYQFAVHPILLSCLDKRQDEQMLKTAHRFYHTTLNRRNENLVWLVLSAAQDKDDHFPAFLHRPELVLQW